MSDITPPDAPRRARDDERPANGAADAPRRSRLRLGQLLLERGWINGEQLLRAVQSQRAVGGRIGTCLLEMDAVSEDHLLDALADQLGVPAIRIDHMRIIDPEVLTLVPPKLAIKYRAVPFAASKSEVRIAALDVDDLAHLDELAFCADKTVRAHIANEARLYEALERYYGVECPQRYGHLLDRLNRVRYLWKDQAAGTSGSAAQAWQGDDSGGFRFVRPDDVFGPLAAPATALDGEVPGEVAGEAADKVNGDAAFDDDDDALTVEPLLDDMVPPLAAPRSLDEVAEELAAIGEVEDLADVLLRFLAGPFVRCALLRGSRARLVGWCGFGPGLDAARLAAIDLAVDAWPAVRGLEADAPAVFRGRLDSAAGESLAACWQGAPADDWWQLEVRLKDRLVAVILGHRDGRPAPPRLVAQLDQLCEKAALALELCILRRKLRRPSRPAEVDLTTLGGDH